MVARAPGKAILAFPVLLFMVAVALVLTARNVAAPSEVHPLPFLMHTATKPQASFAPTTDQGSSSSGSSPATQQPRPVTGPPSSKVKTGDTTDLASSCMSTHCPR